MKMSRVVMAAICTALMASSTIASAQSPQQSTTLLIMGRSGDAPLLQVNGKSYVEIETLARLAQGTLSFKANQVTLTLSPAASGVPASAPPVKQGFSRAFIQAGIEEMSLIREWQIAIVSAVQNNAPLSEDWMSQHRRLADKNLALASAAISTDDDRSGFALIPAELGNMQKLSDRYLAMRKQSSFISPDAFDSDPLELQILSCARGFVSMTASREFQDQPSCHN